MTADVVLTDEPLDSPVALALIGRLNRELQERYPEPGANHFRLDPSEVAPGRGAFLVARVGEEPIGCGAFRVIEGEARRGPPAEGQSPLIKVAEIKRMFVAPEARGQRIGGKLLAALEARAASYGVTRFVLETGTRQPDAVKMYERAGYVLIPAFGEYVGAALSLCMGKGT